MNKIITLLVAFLFTSLTFFGQKKQGYENDSHWFWTLNAGSTWTTTDVKSKNDWGWGLTIGKSFNYDYGRILSFDIRGRYLNGQWYGQDTKKTTFETPNKALSSGNTNYKDSLGYSVLNHWTRANEVSLELVIHANKLRENTGWDLYAFGGIGITGFKANGDLLNNADSNQLYDYNSLPDLSSGTLTNYLDKNYETTLDGSTPGQVNVAFMPSLGFGIGYQLAPRFSMGLEHKTTFTRQDGFDGYYKASGAIQNDWYHYTSAYMRFHLKKRNHGTGSSTGGTVQQVPEVIFTHPNVTGTVVNNPNYTIVALVKHVNGKENINFKQNGNYVGTFTYNAASDQFQSKINLQPGQNVIEIVASNVYGSDQETMVIDYRLPQLAAPIVSFVNPNSNPSNTNNPSFNVQATVLNIENTNQIQYLLNGQAISAYTFTAANGNLTATNNLLIGSNILTITATNSAGSDSKSTTLIYNPIQAPQLPVVYFTNPSKSSTSITNNTFNLEAEVTNVDGIQNISFKQNGSGNQNFTYNANTDDFKSSVVLIPGQNVFEIIASNAAGQAQATTVIIYDKAAPRPPVVTITNPAVNPTTTENLNFPFNATALNVVNQSQVKINLNGKNIPNFSFSAQNGNVSSTLSLLEGSNVVEITATNNDGIDTKQAIIIYKKAISLSAPIVTFVNPSNSPTTIENSSTKITASVLNVDEKSGINLTVNGSNYTSFDFSSASKLVSLNLNLIEGVNIIVVTGSNSVGVDSKSTTIIYKKVATVSPPVVTFIDPIVNPLSVFNQNYTVKAKVYNVSSSKEIVVKINGLNTNTFTYLANSQNLEFDAMLTEGANIVEVTATNISGKDSKTTTLLYKKAEPLAKPIVTITNPIGNSLITSLPTQQINATVLNVESAQNIELIVNSTPLVGFSFNNTNKQLSFVMSLLDGSNTISIKATNIAGESQDSRVIIYKKEIKIDPPVITFINPNKAGNTVNNSNFLFKANVLNIENENQMTLSQNGSIVNPITYTFNTQTKEVSFNTALNEGNNVFALQATNSAGQRSSSTTLIYKKDEIPCENPIITFLNPNASGQEISKSNNVVKLKIDNITLGNQINVYVNGVLQKQGTFNGSNKIYDLNVNYVLGQNIVEVVVKNACGESKANTVVVYKEPGKPCEAPILQLIQPINMESIVELDSYEIRVGVLNIKNASELIFQLNGVNSKFEYNAGTKILIAQIDLQVGMNVIKVQASNECGSGGFPIKITRNECKAPVINITNSSNVDNSSTIMESFHMDGNVTGISERKELVITQNGLPISFIFNETQRTFSFTAKLRMKSNSFEIKAQNNCGADSKVVNVTRNPDPNAVPPIITITNPSANPYNTEEGAFNIQATSKFVTAENQISLTVNGKTINPNFNIGNGSITQNITLVEGANVIVATAVNQYGSSSDSKTIIYSKPVVVQKPVIVLSDPKSCPAILDEGVNFVKGYILNITDLNQVSIKINGVSVPNFTPILLNGKLNFQFTVNIAADNTNLNVVINAQNSAGSDSKSCLLQMKEVVPDPVSCLPVVNAVFSSDSKNVTVTSTKDLSNVVLKFFDGKVEKKDNLRGLTGKFSGSGENTGKCIIGVWIKSGCNQSNDGPGYGQWVSNPQNTSNCSNTPDPADCKPKITNQFSADAKSVTVVSDKDITSIVLKFFDGQEEKIDKITGNSRSCRGTLANTGKCIVGIWVKSGCNESPDGKNYGEYFENSAYKNQCDAKEEPCGVRFNPGNSTAEFCLITPSGTINRDNLMSNANYSYSGPASSVYFTPIAGGGTVTVNGNAYPVQNGTTYLFTGNLTIELKNPTASGMGQWTICVTSNVNPVAGKGNAKPKSPCETANGGKALAKPTGTTGGTRGTTTTPAPTNTAPPTTPIKNPPTPPARRGGGL